jgi:hypothetical protein
MMTVIATACAEGVWGKKNRANQSGDDQEARGMFELVQQ